MVVGPAPAREAIASADVGDPAILFFCLAVVKEGRELDLWFMGICAEWEERPRACASRKRSGLRFSGSQPGSRGVWNAER